jgi:hypothetical protein
LSAGPARSNVTDPYYRSKPLQIWDSKNVRNGHIKRITDADIQSSVLEIMGTNVSTTFIACPSEKKKTLGIKLPFLVMIIKNVRALILFTSAATSAIIHRWLVISTHSS